MCIRDRLNREKIPLVAITGNHDGADRVAVGTSLLGQQGVILANRLEKEIRPVILEREGQMCIRDSNNTVMVHIRRLREKMGETPRHPKFIKTVWGVGYKIEG